MHIEKKQLTPLSRLCGIETEMAFHHSENNKQYARNIHLYDAIIAELKQQTAWATSKRFQAKRGIFLANGSKVEFERLLPGSSTGLLEACSAECQSPAELLAAQRGLESSLTQATDSIEQPNSVCLIKNCGDPRGSVYGAQENYEIETHDDIDQQAYHKLVSLHSKIDKLNGFLFGLAPQSFLVSLYFSYKWGSLVLPAVWLVTFLIGYLVLCLQQRKVISWIEFGYVSLGTLLSPASWISNYFYSQSKIGKTYKLMTPFLVSRGIISGAGMLDKKGRFFLGQKAHSRNAEIWGLNHATTERIVSINEAILEPARHRAEPDIYPTNPLYNKRLRLSLSIGDSNMCETAEYLKIATTTLVIDAIEAGYITDPPKLAKPLRTIHTLNADPSLTKKVITSRGEFTAIEIQQFYLNACRRYVDAQPDAPQEAHDILKLWNTVLQKLSSNPLDLFGQIDWITKRELIRNLNDRDATASTDENFNTNYEFCQHQQLAAMRKIDFKYHELSDDGYYYRLASAGLCLPILAPETIEQARRLPPTSSSARKRGNYIREFADQIDWVTWRKLKLVDNPELIQLQE